MDDKALDASLVAIVQDLFSGPDRDQLSVNTVRQRCEEQHGLDDGFFNGPDWKKRSKDVIKAKVVRTQVLCFGIDQIERSYFLLLRNMANSWGHRANVHAPNYRTSL